MEKLEYSKTENSINEPNYNSKKNFDNSNKIYNFQNNINTNKNIINNKNNEINNKNYLKEINSIIDTKLNFDYSSLLNNSELSLKNSLSNLDQFRINHDEDNNNNNNKIKNNKVVDNKNNLL